MEEILKLISGICWSTVYIILVINGFKYKSYGMPLVALGLNFAWEFFYSFYDFNINDISLQRWINICWFTLDAIIVYQLFIYGRRHFPLPQIKQLFLPWTILIFASCFLIEYLFLMEFGRSSGAKYAAFLQNLIMSILFIDMIARRHDKREFSLAVAICKFLGTLAPTLLFGSENTFILYIGLLCAVMDIIYIGLVVRLRREITPSN